MPTFASDADAAGAGAVTLGSADCRDVNRWWTIARSVGNVAHDLKNALQVISGNVEMLQLRTDLDEVTERRLRSIAAQAVRAVDTMTPLLAYARASASAPDSVDLRALAAVALSFRAVSLGRGGVMTSVTPSNGEPLFAPIDPPSALQILLNLLLQAERDVLGRADASIIVSVDRRDEVVVAVIEGKAQGNRPDIAGESVIADALSARVTAELPQAYGGTLQVERDADHIRLALSLPAYTPTSQAADSAPLSR